MQKRSRFGLRDDFIDERGVNRFGDFLAARAGKGDSVNAACAELRDNLLQHVKRRFNRFAFVADVHVLKNFAFLIKNHCVNAD